jgi:hypothetical protein
MDQWQAARHETLSALGAAIGLGAGPHEAFGLGLLQNGAHRCVLF